MQFSNPTNTFTNRVNYICLPYFFTFFSDCEHLIRKMLVVDPQKRMSMTEIVNHKWIRLAEDDLEFSQLVKESLEPVNHDLDLSEPVLHYMEDLGIERERTVKVKVPGFTWRSCKKKLGKSWKSK